MTTKELIDTVDNMIALNEMEFQFEEFLEAHGFSITSTYNLTHTGKSLVDWTSKDVFDIKITIFEDIDKSYIMTVVSEDAPDLDFSHKLNELEANSYKTPAELIKLIRSFIMEAYNLPTEDRLDSYLESLGYGYDSNHSKTINSEVTDTTTNSDDSDKSVEYKWEYYYVAVYGTLRNSEIMKDCDHLETCVLDKYAMYDAQVFPYAVYTGNVDDRIVVDIYRIDNETLQTLDSIEGIAYKHYVRKTIGESNCLIYLKGDASDLNTYKRVPYGKNDASDWVEYYNDSNVDVSESEPMPYSEFTNEEFAELVEAFEIYLGGVDEYVEVEKNSDQYWELFNVWLESDESETDRDEIFEYRYDE